MSTSQTLRLGTVPEHALLHDGSVPATGIVHLGLSNFHRAHLAVYTSRAVAAAGGDWGIYAYSLRSEEVPHLLREQDLLYSVIDIAPGSEGVAVPAIHTAALGGTTDPWDVVRQIGAAPTRIVSITVTEAGYSISPRTGALDRDDPLVEADLGGAAPRTVVGLVVRGLQQRAATHREPITVLSCDNLSSNGDRTSQLVHEFASLLPADERDELLDYLRGAVTFPNSMVDRIVPRPVEEHRQMAVERLGVEDRAAVPAEPFTMWVIEDRFAGGRPAWERAGAIFSTEVEAYELMKLRLLNGTHSLLAYAGALAGCATIPEARGTGFIEEAARSLLIREYLPTLTVPSGISEDEYIEELFARWSNSVLGHRTGQVGSDGSVKLPQRITEPLIDLAEKGWTPPFICLTVAAYLACLVPFPGFDPGPFAAEMTDPSRELLAELGRTSSGPDEVVQRFLDESGLLPPALTTLSGFSTQVTDYLNTIVTDGIHAAIAQAHRAPSWPQQNTKETP